MGVGIIIVQENDCEMKWNGIERIHGNFVGVVRKKGDEQ